MIANWNKNPFKVLYNSTCNMALNLGAHRHCASKHIIKKYIGDLWKSCEWEVIFCMCDVLY